MNKLCKNIVLIVVASTLVITFGGGAYAATTTAAVVVSGFSSPGGTPVSASVSFTYNDVSGLLTISITNLSVSGSITGAGFNAPGARTAMSGNVTTQPAGGSMVALNSAGGPYASGSTGNYEFGIATTTNNGLQSGQPAQGIGVGESASATFVISSPGGITAASFVNELNASGNAMVVRIQNIRPFEDSAHATTITRTPEPSTFLLLGTGLLALGLARRKKN